MVYSMVLQYLVYKIIRILHAMVSGIPVMLGLGTRMSDPYVVVAWPLNCVAC